MTTCPSSLRVNWTIPWPAINTRAGLSLLMSEDPLSVIACNTGMIVSGLVGHREYPTPDSSRRCLNWRSNALISRRWAHHMEPTITLVVLSAEPSPGGCGTVIARPPILMQPAGQVPSCCARAGPASDPICHGRGTAKDHRAHYLPVDDVETGRGVAAMVSAGCEVEDTRPVAMPRADAGWLVRADVGGDPQKRPNSDWWKRLLPPGQSG